MQIEQAKLDRFMGKMLVELGAAINAALVLTGDKLGLYKAMMGAGPMTVSELAAKTGTDERYLREWLSAQAAGEIVEYDAESGCFSLPDEHALALAVEDSPAFLPGAFQVLASVMKDEPRITDAFRTGEGVGWHEHHPDLFHGTERFFRPGYAAHLVGEWLPSLDGVVERLKAGGKVADVGCGHGSSTILLAQAFPNSTFHGYDYHDASIEAARRAAERAGVADRTFFDVASAKAYPGGGFDLVTFFDCLHDMGDPQGAAAHVLQSLAADGTWMIVEPFAGDKLQENLNPVGRMFYCASTMICTPGSRAQEVGLCLGAQAGEQRIGDVVRAAGFTRFRRATHTPFNLVFEARP
ncbi:methyltransferase [Paludibaculum fermentans]|uniref:class I SAM-dependent methyltransferase n=1 Tax=Paludibaculum fermentans TaxID=1473598 RepID=UPI003EBBA5C1